VVYLGVNRSDDGWLAVAFDRLVGAAPGRGCGVCDSIQPTGSAHGNENSLGVN